MRSPATAGGAVTAGTVGVAYSTRLRAEGGIPSYDWEVVGGSLPPGIVLDRFTGELRGVATRAGVYEPSVRLRDQDLSSPGLTRRVRFEMAGPQ